VAKTQTLGLGDLTEKYRSLRDDMKTRTAARMVVSAGSVLRDGAKSIARAEGLVRTGALIKNIAIKRETQGVPEGTMQYNLGVRHGRDLTKKQKTKSKLAVGRNGRIVKQYVDDPFYFRFPELGTKHQGKTSYLGASLDANAAGAIAAMEKPLNQALEKAQQS
jgi:HK97 gp10 family phage protein